MLQRSLSLFPFSLCFSLFLLFWFLVSLFWPLWRTLSFIHLLGAKYTSYWHPRFSQTLAERTQRIGPRPVKSLVFLAADWGVFAVLWMLLSCESGAHSGLLLLYWPCVLPPLQLSFVWPSRALFAFSALCFDRVSQCWLTYATHLRRAVRSIEYHIYIKLSRVDPSISRASISEGCQLWYQLLPLRK